MVLLVFLKAAPVVWSEEILPQESLVELVEAYEKTEKELALLERDLKSSKGRQENRLLQGRIQQMKSLQDQRAAAIERMVGPLPVVEPTLKNPLESQIEAQEKRHETVLEKDVEDRLR
ncbi:MAG: hypothetical protein HYZ88_03035 [Candidatus Omnitrophica bacterium]|nr:hypothetical protein [Candidatus Omnitrophota bacterium]